MTKLRESLSTVFAVFAGVFVVYIVLDWGMDITGRRRRGGPSMESQEIGVINDEPIYYKDFSDMVKQVAENQKAQTNNEPDENQLRTIRDQVWNDLVEEKLFDEQIQKFGIAVTDQEIVDWVRGDNPPDFLRQRFTDSTGVFNRQAYESAIQNPKNKAAWLQVEGILRKQRKREKLQSIILSGLRVPESEVLQKFTDQNTKYEAEYALFEPNQLVRDDEIKVTDDDLRHYYNEHSEEFKFEPSRRLKYVMFNEVPSRADTESVTSELDDVAQRARDGADFQDLAKTYSEAPVSDAFFKHGEISQDKENAVFTAKSGEIIGPLKDFDGYHVIKVGEFRTGKDNFIHASHILIQIENNDSVKALKEAREVLASARQGQDFATLAQQHSKDVSSASRGGDLGWFGKGRMVKSFEEAAFKTRPGQIVGPVRTQFGYHIIKVIAYDNREVKFADIRISVKVSGQTRDALNQQSQDFQYLAKQGDFVKEAQAQNYTVSETPAFQKNAVIPGVGVNNALNKFAFNGKVGSISDVISLSNGYGVFMISDVKDAGMRPFDEMKTTLDARVRREKKMEKVRSLATQLRQSLNARDSLTTLAAHNGQIIVQKLASFTLSGTIPGVGRDLAFIGGISSLNAGEISKPIESSRGYYVIRLITKSPFDSTLYNAQKELMRAQLLRDERNRFFTEWLDQLKKSADIVDNRDVFYR